MKTPFWLFLLLAGALQAQPAQVDSIVLQLWDRSTDARHDGNYREALELIGQAIRLDERNGPLYNSRGKTRFDMVLSDQFEGMEDSLLHLAYDDYSTAIRLGTVDTSKAEALINRGAVLGFQGKMEEALSDFNRGILLDSTNENGYLNRSIVYVTHGRYQEAIADYTTCLKLDPENAQLYYERGMVRRALRRSREALEDLNKAIQLDPSMPLAYLERARALRQLGEMKTARFNYNRALKLGAELQPEEIRFVGEEKKN